MLSDMCSEVPGPSSSGSGDLFELSDGSKKTISPTASITGCHLGFERDRAYFLSGRITSLCTRSIGIGRNYTLLFSAVRPVHWNISKLS